MSFQSWTRVGALTPTDISVDCLLMLCLLSVKSGVTEGRDVAVKHLRIDVSYVGVVAWLLGLSRNICPALCESAAGLL